MPTCGFAGTVDELGDLLDAVAATGCDEVQLIPTGSDVGQVHAVTALLRSRAAAPA